MLQLRRITSSGRFVPEIDGLRFAAIAAVVLTHLHGFTLRMGAVPGGQDFFRPFVEHGYRGVNLFYVISGFILGLPFAAHYLKDKPSVSLKAYFLRRLTRLEPPYILNLLICFAFLLTVEGSNGFALAPHLAASLGYVHNLWFGEQSTINPVAWSLEVEVQFYCLVPLLALLFSIRQTRARRLILLGLILLAGIAQMCYWEGSQRLKLTILYAIQYFLTGFLLADIYLLDWNERPATHWGWDLLSLLCWPLIILPGDREVWIALPLLMLGAYIAAFKGVLFRGFFRHVWITTVGGMCYTIYLFHYLLIPPVLRLLGGVGGGAGFGAYFVVQLLLYTPILLLVSGCYFVLVERPCMAKDWPQRARKRTVALLRRD